MKGEIKIEKEKEEIFEIQNKKYKVITKVIENSQDINKLYDIFCKYAISRLN